MEKDRYFIKKMWTMHFNLWDLIKEEEWPQFGGCREKWKTIPNSTPIELLTIDRKQFQKFLEFSRRRKIYRVQNIRVKQRYFKFQKTWTPNELTYPQTTIKIIFIPSLYPAENTQLYSHREFSIKILKLKLKLWEESPDASRGRFLERVKGEAVSGTSVS